MTEEQELQNGSIAGDDNSWFYSLPDDLKTSESLKKFKDISSLASSYLELEKNLSSRVVIPKSDASPEERQKFYIRLGCPENGRYTDDRPAEDEEEIQKWEKRFTRNGLITSQGQDILKELYNDSVEYQKKQEEEIQNFRNSNLDKLKNYYSDKGGFNSKTGFIELAINKYAQPDAQKNLVSCIEETQYNPELINFLINVGETLKSDSLVTSNEKTTIIGAESALKEIKRLESDEDFMLKYKKGNELAVSQMRQLHEIAYNTHVTTSSRS
ncbi:MAG TPA: hypothetical protein LFW21_01735 [Rickettsia endosymbiont of Pyrocoelia pectoralis]|nr:hypothetical protein [Rickettsia endosymbiont of Pyrocoelia pectoralis]